MVLEEGVIYRMDLVDDISKVSRDIEGSQEKLKDKVRDTNQEVIRQDVSFIKSVASLSALRRGVTGVVSGLEGLGVISEKTHGSIYQCVHAINLFVGAAQALKGVIGLVDMLRASEIGLSVVQAFRKTLENPAMLGVVIGASAGAGAVAGYLYSQSQPGAGGGSLSQGTTVNQTMNFYGSSPNQNSRYTQRDALEGVG